MSIEMMIDDFMSDDDVDMDVVKYECYYWSVIDSMADLIMNNGRDKVMADVTDVVVKRLNDGYVVPNDESFL